MQVISENLVEYKTVISENVLTSFFVEYKRLFFSVTIVLLGVLQFGGSVSGISDLFIPLIEEKEVQQELQGYTSPHLDSKTALSTGSLVGGDNLLVSPVTFVISSGYYLSGNDSLMMYMPFRTLQQDRRGRLSPQTVDSFIYAYTDTTYCSAIARNNLERITGLSTTKSRLLQKKKTPIYQGDAITVFRMLQDKELLNIFSTREATYSGGDKRVDTGALFYFLQNQFTRSGTTIYDVYLHNESFGNDIRSTHRFMIFLGIDNVRYALDPVRTSNVFPLALEEYIGRYISSEEELSLLHQGYRPSRAIQMKKISLKKKISTNKVISRTSELSNYVAQGDITIEQDQNGIPSSAHFEEGFYYHDGILQAEMPKGLSILATNQKPFHITALKAKTLATPDKKRVEKVSGFLATIQSNNLRHQLPIKASQSKRFLKTSSKKPPQTGEVSSVLSQHLVLDYVFEFGVSGQHLIFSEPVHLAYAVDLPDGTPVQLSVKHDDDKDYGVGGLSIDPNTLCTEGEATLPGHTTEVLHGQVEFWTCGASTFSITYTGGADTAHFVDNGSKDYTVVIQTGVAFPTGSVLLDTNILVDFRPIDNESPSGPRGTTNCYPNEKSFLLIHPDGTQVALADADTYTTPSSNCPQAQILYDQQASTAIVGGAWDLSGQARQPVGDLSNLNGKSPFGTWTLRMADNAGQDGALLFGFNLQLQNIECGDGIISVGEACDDSNATNGDGCSLVCQVEAGRTCTGTPSVCTLIPAPSGLRLHYDGSSNGTEFTDISGNGNTGKAYNGVTTANQSGETVMCFNGTNQYIERVANLATAYPFTMSSWVKPTNVSGLKGVMSLARSSATNRMYNLELNATTWRARAQNTTARYANGTTSAIANQWFLVTTVFTSNTSRQVYVNGAPQGINTTSVTYDTSTSKRIDIGRLADSSPSNYFGGCVDDIHFYTTGLTSGQVYQLYAKPAVLTTSIVTVGSPLLTGTMQGLLDTVTLTINGNNYTTTNNGNGTWTLSAGSISPTLQSDTYPTTITVTNPYGRAVSYSGAFTVSLPLGDLCIEGPDTFSLGSYTIKNIAQDIEVQSDYFKVDDQKGNSDGYYTTISLSALSGSFGSSIPLSSIEIKADPIVTLSGSSNPSVVLNSGITSYTSPLSPVTFIQRASGAGSNIFGTYGSKLWININVPAYQSLGAYSGTITYTLYEN